MGGLRWTIAGALLALVPRGRGASSCRRRRAGDGIAAPRVPDARAWQRRRRRSPSSGCRAASTAVLVATLSVLDGRRRSAACRTARSCVRRWSPAWCSASAASSLLVWPELTFGTSGHRGFLAGVIARADRGVRLVARIVVLASATARSGQRPRHHRLPDAGRRADDGRRRNPARRVGRARSSRPRSALALAYLATVGAIGGFVAYTYALRHLPVSFVSLYAYINPVIAVALGVLLLHEPFTSRMAVAAVLVFAGVARRSPRRRTRPAARESRDAARRGGRQPAADRLERRLQPMLNDSTAVPVASAAAT